MPSASSDGNGTTTEWAAAVPMDQDGEGRSAQGPNRVQPSLGRHGGNAELALGFIQRGDGVGG